uniref:REPAT n=1 Tax=Spodoptera exigua TaxID=7107 RepID=A0A8E4Q928_SPOEX|nr:REPAT [Spodoptera exigua]
MKDVLLIALLAVTLGCATADSRDLPEPAASGSRGTDRSQLAIGEIGSSRILSSTTHRVPSENGIAHTQDVLIRLVEYANITAIRGTTSFLSAAEIFLLEGGLGHNYVKLGFITEKGFGYNYAITVYGDMVCKE